MIRANLKAGGSIQVVGSEITATVSGNSLVFSGISADAQAIVAYTTTADQYGSNFTFMAMLDDPSNPIAFVHTGGFGAISSASYSSGVLTVTLATLNMSTNVVKAKALST